MKNVRIALVGFALVALVAACSQSADETAAEPEETADTAEEADPATEADEAAADPAAGEVDEVEEQAMAFMEEVAASGVEHVEDCDAVAAAWRDLIDENQDLLTQMSERAATQTPEDQAAFEERYAERLGTFMEQMTEVIAACQENPEILELMEELSTQ